VKIQARACPDSCKAVTKIFTGVRKKPRYGEFQNNRLSKVRIAKTAMLLK
jgi:hypothetical protein